MVRYEAGVGRSSGADFADFRSERSQYAAEVIGRAYAPPGFGAGSRSRPFSRTLEQFAQLILPVTLLLALSAVAFLYGDHPAQGFASNWLTPGHLLLPLTFFSIALTNRRYGAGMALAQTLLAWIAGAAAVLLDPQDVAGIAGRALPAMQTLLGFGGGLLAGQLFSIAVFDLTRGPRWFVAPMLAWLLGGLMFVLIAVPVSLPGAAWNGDLGLYAGIMAAAAFAMLIPYWMLRAMVPPLPGFGGY